MLNKTPKTPVQFRERCAEVLGLSDTKELDKNYPGFSSGSINASLKRSLAPLVQGDAEAGYTLSGDKTIKKAFKEAILYEANAGISLARILGSEKAAPHIVKITQTLFDEDNIATRTSFAKASGVNRTSLREHLKRLRGLGFVTGEPPMLTAAGDGFVYFLSRLEYYHELPQRELKLDDMTLSLDLYAQQWHGDKGIETRKREILDLLRENPGLSRVEINTALGSTADKPLKALRQQGDVVMSGGKGSPNSPYLFSLAEYE